MAPRQNLKGSAKRKHALDSFLDKTPLLKLSECHLEAGSTIDVPGDWWEGGPRAELGLVFKCSVVEWDPLYKWPAGVRDQVPEGAFTLSVEGRDEDPYQMSLLDYCKFLNKQKPAVQTLTAGASSSGASDGDDQTAPTTSNDARDNTTSKVWEYIRKLSDSEVQDIKSSGGKENCECKLCGRKLTQIGKQTSGIGNHLRTTHKLQYDLAMESSKHTKTRMSEAGTLVTTFSFSDLLVHHIRFVIWCVLKKRPFFIALDDEFRSFVRGLEARYTPPCRVICWKIVDVLVELLKVQSSC